MRSSNPGRAAVESCTGSLHESLRLCGAQRIGILVLGHHSLSGEQLDIRGQCVSVAEVTTEANDTRIITKESLEAFFEKHAPHLVSRVDECLEEYTVDKLVNCVQVFDMTKDNGP